MTRDERHGLCDKFHHCIDFLESGELDAALEMIKNDPELKIFSEGDRSLMSVAASISMTYAKEMIENGVALDKLDTTGSTLLMDFSALPEVDMLELFLQHGAMVNVINDNGESAFSFACARGNLEAAKLLYKYGADIDIEIGLSKTKPIDWARMSGSKDLVDWLESKNKED